MSITHAVITVPAYFSQIQKAETLEAAKLAGFTEVKLITEPAAGKIYSIIQIDIFINKRNFPFPIAIYCPKITSTE